MALSVKITTKIVFVRNRYNDQKPVEYSALPPSQRSLLSFPHKNVMLGN